MNITPEEQDRRVRIAEASRKIMELRYSLNLSHAEWLWVLASIMHDEAGWSLKHSHRRNKKQENE